MFKLMAGFVSLFLISLPMQASIKDCGTALNVARSGTLTLTKDEPTDLRGLPGSAVAQIVKTLKGQWIQVTTRQVFPVFGTSGGLKTSIIRILEMGERYRYGRPMVVVVAAMGDHAFKPLRYSDSSVVTPSPITTEVYLNDIVSIQLVEVPEVTVSLFNSNGIDGKNSTIYNKKLDEKIISLAEGDSDAALILSKLSGADYPKINDRQGSFDAFLTLLDLQNIRGRQLVAAYRLYANQNLTELINGVINKPGQVAHTINKNTNQFGNHTPLLGNITLN